MNLVWLCLPAGLFALFRCCIWFRLGDYCWRALSRRREWITFNALSVGRNMILIHKFRSCLSSHLRRLSSPRYELVRVHVDLAAGGSHVARLKSAYSLRNLSKQMANTDKSWVAKRNVSEYRLTNKNSIQEEIKSRLKVGNACYNSVQNLLSSSLLSKKLKVKIYRTIILPVCLYGCETWSLTLREERRLRVSENRVLRRVFGPKRDEVIGKGENYIMKSSVICTPYRILCGW